MNIEAVILSQPDEWQLSYDTLLGYTANHQQTPEQAIVLSEIVWSRCFDAMRMVRRFEQAKEAREAKAEQSETKEKKEDSYRGE